MNVTRRQVIVWLPAAMALVRCGRPPVEMKVLSPAQATALDALADQVLPDGHLLGAAGYVERLLSGVDPVISSLGVGEPLDRLAKAAWSQRVAAVKEQLLPVLDGGKPLGELSAEDRELICALVTEGAFARPEYGGNPKQAGSKLIGSAGSVMPDGFVKWDGEKNVEKSDAPVSTAEPGDDPFPFDKWTRDLLDEVTRATGGRIAS